MSALQPERRANLDEERTGFTLYVSLKRRQACGNQIHFPIHEGEPRAPT
jgi:hypothetical protein